MGFVLGQRVFLDGEPCTVQKMVGGDDAIVERLKDGKRYAVDSRRVTFDTPRTAAADGVAVRTKGAAAASEPTEPTVPPAAPASVGAAGGAATPED